MVLKPAEKGPAPAPNPCAACPVRGLSVCGALEPDDLDRLNGIVSHIHLAHGQPLFFEADSATHLFVITNGCVKLYKLLADGRRQITGFLFPSDFLGIALRDRYAYSAEAVTASTLCRFRRDRLEALLKEFPSLERRLLGIASNELAAAQDQMLLLGRKTAEEKLGSFLHALSRRAALRGLAPNRLDLPMTRADIADYLGLTVETVSRCFTRLRNRELVGFDKPQAMRINNAAALAALSGAD